MIVNMGGVLSLARSSIRKKFGVDLALNMQFDMQFDMDLSFVWTHMLKDLHGGMILMAGLGAGRHTRRGGREVMEKYEARHVGIKYLVRN